jgi:hypothetical protein
MGNSKIISNNAKAIGGFLKGVFMPLPERAYVIYWKDCYLFNNSALNGGVVGFNTRSGEYLWENCIFEYNFAKNRGGAIFLYCEWSTHLLTTSCIFKNNMANSGGAISNMIGNYFDKNSVFHGNHAIKGSTMVFSSYSENLLFGSMINNSYASDSHTIVAMNIARLTLTNVAINNCKAIKCCAGISVYNHALLLFINSSVIDNHAEKASVFYSVN